MFNPLKAARNLSTLQSGLKPVSTLKKSVSLDRVVSRNETLSEALELFRANDVEAALRISLSEYKKEFNSMDHYMTLNSSHGNEEASRPAFTFLSEIIASLGPRNSLAISAIAEMQSVGEECTPMNPRLIRRHHGGYPVRLNNGKWTWQGPHWSRRNNRTWKTGYASDFTYGWVREVGIWNHLLYLFILRDLMSSSAGDLFAVDLPSDSESDDSDYVTDGEGSSSSFSDAGSNDKEQSRSYRKEIQRHKIRKVFEALVKADEEIFLNENHSDVLIDPLMLEFQRREPKARKDTSIQSIERELDKYTNIVKTENQVDVMRYKKLARGTALSVDRSSVDRALKGISDSKVEVAEEVRFAGEIVQTKKFVERTSSHAARYERKKRIADEQAGGSLGSFQTYLNQIKSHRGVSSVEKSATDWNEVKINTKGMEEALQVDRGFIEKQAFLVRSGAKEDELRREARRKKLMESSPPS